MAMSGHHHHQRKIMLNAGIKNYDNNNDRNGGGFGFGDNAGFESWACEEFNLIDYLGEDSSPLDEVTPDNMNEDELQKQKEDALYSQLQYSDLLIGDNQQQRASPQQHDFGINDYASVPSGYSAVGPSEYDVPSFRDNSAPSNTELYLRQTDAVPYVPSTSKSSVPIVKQEPISEHDIDVKLNFTSASSRESSVISGVQLTTVPGTSSITSKPRKYRIKPECEKLNPVYRIKRQKNNDAVRRSRDKAKRIQEAKENELKFLQEDNTRKAEIIETLKTSNAQLQAENMLLKQNCRCGGITRLQKR